MVFTGFGLTRAFCQKCMTGAAEAFQSGSNLFYALIKHGSYSHIAQIEGVWSEDAKVNYTGDVMTYFLVYLFSIEASYLLVQLTAKRFQSPLGIPHSVVLRAKLLTIKFFFIVYLF